MQSIPIVAVVAMNRFSPFHLSVPTIVFGGILPEKLFDLRLCAGEPGDLRSDSGFLLEPTHGLEGLEDADIVIVPYWRSPREKPDHALLAALTSAHARGAQLVGLCLGAYVLAYAGLLHGRRAATHWEFEQDFQNRFPTVRLDTNALYVDDGALITSAGTAAGLDCCLHIVRHHHGGRIANRVARRLVIPPHREGGQAQFIDRPMPESTEDARLSRLLERMRASLHQPLSLDTLASEVMMTRRTFTRQFHKATGMAVGAWLLAERLRRCQELLETTALPMDAIAEQTGFPSTPSLRGHFRRRFGVTPREWRVSFQGRRASKQS